MVQLTERPVRELSADDLGIGVDTVIADHASNRPDDPPLDVDDVRLAEVRELLQVYGGVIFTGPPGTSKTWYAGKIGTALVDGDEERIKFVQFHPSYQYEDFIYGFVPREAGDGFELRRRYFVEICEAAERDPQRPYVLVIDELSRGDPGRVFGEALTYVEKSKRGMRFTLASGKDCVVPPNLVILATMNPFDRGVDEVDAAFERRFAKIAMDPDRNILQNILEINELREPLRREIVRLFDMMNGRARSSNPQAAVGHTFFTDVRDVASLESLWQHQLRFLMAKAYRLDPQTYDDIAGAWERTIQIARETASAEAAVSDADPEAPARDAGQEPDA